MATLSSTPEQSGKRPSAPKPPRCTTWISARIRRRNCPESQGLWSPRWSPDGRYLVAETADSLGLKIFDFHTRKWSDLTRVPGVLGYTAWSRNSKYVYFNTYDNDTNAVYRIRIEGKHPAEMVLDLKTLPQPDTLGRWFTLAPDDSPLVLRDTSIREIYSLQIAK